MAYATAFMETLTICHFPYYSFEDRDMAYTVGSAFYGIYFIVSFPMYFAMDEPDGPQPGPGPRLAEPAIHSFAAGYATHRTSAATRIPRHPHTAPRAPRASGCTELLGSGCPERWCATPCQDDGASRAGYRAAVRRRHTTLHRRPSLGSDRLSHPGCEVMGRFLPPHTAGLSAARFLSP